MKKIFVFTLCLLIAFGTLANAQVKTSGEEAFKHIKYLASDDFKGRKSGTPEYQKAAEYVRDKMIEYGLKPGMGEGQWFQEVPFRNWQYFKQPISLKMTSPQKREYFAGRGNDYQPVRGSGSGKVKGKLVFAGYGIISGSNNWNDYDNIDVKGKIVLIIPDGPKGISDNFSEKERASVEKIKIAVEKGAKGVIFMNTPPVQYGSYRVRLNKNTCPDGFVVMMAERPVIDHLFYSSNLSWKYMLSRTIREKRSFSAELDVEVEMKVNQEQGNKTAPNVIGIIPGTDPQLKNEYIVIGGHLDHLGIGIDGFIYNGADDDASGVAVVLEVARAIKAANFRPKRTVVFCAWAGEEMGLVGATYYTRNAPYPLDKTVIYLNMDMVGQGDTDLFVGGMYVYQDLFNIATKNLSSRFDNKFNYRYNYRGSDHSAFLRAGVPWISLRSGGLLNRNLDDEHPEYHKPGDMSNTIDVEALDIAAEYHYEMIKTLANSNENLLDPVHKMNFVHKDATLVDLHSDTAMRLEQGEDVSGNTRGHIDIPKLKEGGVDLQVFACYVGPPTNDVEKYTAGKKIFNMIDDVQQLLKENPDDLALIESYDDFRGNRSTGKTGILIGIEGGYAIENDISMLRSFYRSGVRLMTLTHWTHTDWADASGDPEPLFDGLTEFGEEVVKEMNDLGMIIDVSHVHDETFWDVIRISDDPIVASHSCARALADHFRNLSDDMLRAVAENGGMVGINYYPGFLSKEFETRSNEVWVELTGKHGLPVDYTELLKADRAKQQAFFREYGPRVQRILTTDAPVNVKTVVNHIDHIVKVTGSADHVGLGSDFDGISNTPVGLEHTGKLSAITIELFNRGYSEEDIRKILGGNFIRILRQVCDK
ncbi:MAG: M20/M25/M40 family metallo-hydrolase [bacterium]|nr:M20/M25/M40 family metallo-hydrolase [bacterium]